jgi:hypothetical protein
MRVGMKETQFGYFANSGVRVEILRAEALFFLDFDFVEPSGSLVTFFDQAKKVT